MQTERTKVHDSGVRTGSSAVRTVVPAFVCVGLAAMVLTLGAFNSEVVVANAFERAFAALEKPVARAAPTAYDGVAGTEEFWLHAQGNANVVNAVAVGQQITLTANGTQRRLTITDVSEAGDAVTHIETGGSETAGGRARILLVTCREGDAKTGHEVRLRLDAGFAAEEPAGSTHLAPRAL